MKFCLCRWPGRAHDARIWNKSPLKEILGELMDVGNLRIDDTFHIIGDSAYPMSNYLMTPYKQRGLKLNDHQKKFNTHLASKRAVIERAFALLGLRFPRVTLLPFRSNKKRIQCVVACCVLHNWCLIEDDDDESAFDSIGEDLQTDVNTEDPGHASQRNNSGGVTKRDILCQIVKNLQ